MAGPLEVSPASPLPGSGSNSYALDNDDPRAAEHHRRLSLLWDGWSMERAWQLVGDFTGKRCLEVGCGVGASLAVWMAEQVGPNGFVLATDVRPRQVPGGASRLTVLDHDLTSGVPLQDGWDFIHARLVLGHIRQRREVLRWLTRLLRPGGVILVEDWDTSDPERVLSAPSGEDGALFTEFQHTLGSIFTAAGTDRMWAPQIHRALLDDGLVEVATVMHSEAWPSGSDGAMLVALAAQQMWDRLLAEGLSTEHLVRVTELLTGKDPRFAIAGYLMYSTSGRRPDGVPVDDRPWVKERFRRGAGVNPFTNPVDGVDGPFGVTVGE